MDSYRLYLCVCLCVCVCLSVPLLRLISRLLWVRFWSNLVKMSELWSECLYWNFIKIGSVLTLLWRHSFFFYLFKRSNSSEREATLLKEKKLCSKGWELYCSRLWHKRQISSCTIILSIYQTLKKHINHVYQNQTCIDVIDVGVSAFSECLLLLVTFYFHSFWL